MFQFKAFRITRTNTKNNNSSSFSDDDDDDAEEAATFDTDWSIVGANEPIAPLVAGSKRQFLAICDLDDVTADQEPLIEFKVKQTRKIPLLKQAARHTCTFCKKKNINITNDDDDDSPTTNNKRQAQPTLRRCTKCYRASYCDSECQHSDWSRHKTSVCSLPSDTLGLPFVMTLRSSELLDEAAFRRSLISSCFQTLDVTKNTPLDYDILLMPSNEPLSLATLSKLLGTGSSSSSSNLCLQLNVRWLLEPEKIRTDLSRLKRVECAASGEEPSAMGGGAIKLDECLKLFTKAERLTSDNPWYCAKCGKHQEATKQMSLWRLPKCLIVTLKRFQAQKAFTGAGVDAAAFQSRLNSPLGYLIQNHVVYKKINLIDFPLT